ncbi:hypothetical protein ACFLWM_02290 [Chloroflexota bacterium]
MYKKIGLILVFYLLLIPLVSCNSETAEQVPQVNLDEFSAFDLDNDGEHNRYVYKFGEEEISDDVYLTRTIEFKKTDEGTEGKISLQFDDKSQGNDYRHVENIPKEFASHIDELKFSVPPDEIINPDPEVAWDKKQIEIGAGYLIDITKNIEKWDADRVIAMSALTVIQYSKAKFARMESGPERDKAVLQTASQLIDMIEFTDMTADPFGFEGKAAVCTWCSQPYVAAACWAILSGNAKECDASKLSEDDIDLCRGIYIQNKCEDIADKEAREKCYLENAIDIGCEIACNTITDKDKRNLCLAVVKDDVEYCEKIEDQATYEQCLRECGRSPDGSYVRMPFSCDSDCPAPPEDFSRESCNVTEEEDYSVLSCEYLKTRKCEDWRYNLIIGGERATDEEYTDCAVAYIHIDIFQWESGELAEASFQRRTEGLAGDSKYLLRSGVLGQEPFKDYDTWLREYTLDRNYVLEIEVYAVGESESEALLAKIKPSVLSVISKTE